MFNNIENKPKVSHFANEQGLLFLIKGKSLYLNDIQINGEYLERFGPLSILGFHKNIYVQDWEGNYLIYKINEQKLNYGKGRYFFQIKGRGNLIGVELLKDQKLYLSIVKTAQIWEKEIALFNHENYCSDYAIFLLMSKEEVLCVDIQTGDYLWSFKLPETKYDWYNLDNVYISERSIPIKAEIKRIIGVHNDVLWISLNSGRLLGLAIHTGMLRHDLAAPTNFYTYFSKESNHFGSAADSLLDEDRGVVFGLHLTYYWEIDLGDPENEYILYDISEQCNKNLIGGGGITYDLTWEGDEIFFYQWSFAQDPSYVGIFNRNTREITWTSRELGEDGVFKGVNKVEYSGNRLYVLDRANTLHIFER